MRNQFRFAFVVFYFTAVLILTVYLRSSDNRIFYNLCTNKVEQGRLKQELWQKQLQLESLINPAAVSERLGYWKPGCRNPNNKDQINFIAK